MNKTKLLVIVSSVLVLSACGSSSNSSKAEFKRYEVDSGTIVYQLTGMEQGIETLYFKDWGSTEVRYKKTTLSVFGMKTGPANNSMTLVIGDDVFNIDLNKNTGTRITNSLEHMGAAGKNANLGKTGMQMLEAMGGEKTGSKTVAGKKCDVYTMKNVGTSTCIWKNLTLETTSNMAGMQQTNIATNIDTDTNIADEKFKIPEGVTFIDLKNLFGEK